MSDKRVTIVDYDMGNVDSVARAVKQCGGSPQVSRDERILREASHIILPGVGAFRQGMNNLTNLGLKEILEDRVIGSGVPLLGICIGMQLLAKIGYEGGETEGLGFIDGNVEKLSKASTSERIPHVGWNEINFSKNSFLFEGLENKSDCYFVHSYHLTCHDSEDVVGTTPYCGGFVSVINRKNISGVQFHPEKSQEAGLKLLNNFLDL